jgi:hypothetical protein
MEYLNEFLTFLSGGIIYKLLDFFISNKKVRQDEFSKIVEQWQKDNERLRKENQALTISDKLQSEKINELERKISNMEFQMNFINDSYRKNHGGKGLFDSKTETKETENKEL